MKKIIYLLFILPLVVNAQSHCDTDNATSGEGQPSSNSSEGNYNNINLVSTYSNRNNNVKGSPYAFKDWCKCEVVTTDNSITKYEKVQFDIEKNMLIVYNNGVSSTIPINQIKSFIAKGGNSNRQFSSIDKSNFTEATEDKLYEIFSNNNYLIKETIKYVQTSSDDSGKKYYKKRTSYYVLNSFGKYTKTKLNKKHLLKVLKDKEKDVLKYIKENKLSYKEKDVSKIMTFYHSLT